MASGRSGVRSPSAPLPRPPVTRRRPCRFRGGPRSSLGVIDPGGQMKRPLFLTAALAAILCVLTGTARAAAPTFTNFPAPAPLGRDAGEPSIGADWATGNVMMQAGVETLRVSGFSDATGGATWRDVAPLLTSVVTLDPILFTDHRTNRTFVSELSADCSLMAFTDDDGASWVQNPVGCGLASGADHQAVGGGAFAAPLSGVGYADSVYYCAQLIATAQCALSVDGGI